MHDRLTGYLYFCGNLKERYMKLTAQEISDLLNGQVEGDKEVEVNKVAKIEEGEQGAVSFLANPQYTPYVYTSNASVIIVEKGFVPDQPVKATLIKVESPYSAFAQLLEVYNRSKDNRKGVSSQAYIASSAAIGKNVYIGPFVYIGDNVVVGDNTRIYPGSVVDSNSHIGSDCLIFSNVAIYSDCRIGDGVTLHAGVVVGSDGFGFAPQQDDNYLKVAQIGNVVIEDHVEVGANTTIDRATMGSTIIRKGVKLDNLIQIAHNAEIDENTVIAALTGVSGSTKVGKNCMIGGQAGLVGHIQIADDVRIGAQAGVSSSIRKKGFTALGSPAIDYNTYKKAYVHFKNLNQMARRVDELETKLKEMEDQLNNCK